MKQPSQSATELFPLYLLILHHVHYNPVEGIDVLPNEILEHDECFHQKILKQEKIFGKDSSYRSKNHTSDSVSY